MQSTGFNSYFLNGYSGYGNVDKIQDAQVVIVTHDDAQSAQNMEELFEAVGEDAVFLVAGTPVGEQLDDQVKGMDSPAVAAAFQQLQQSNQREQKLFVQFTNDLVDKGEGAFCGQNGKDLMRVISDQGVVLLLGIQEELTKNGLVTALRQVEQLGKSLTEEHHAKTKQLLRNTSPERQACFQKAIEANVKPGKKVIAFMHVNHVSYPSIAKGVKEFVESLQTQDFIVLKPQEKREEASTPSSSTSTIEFSPPNRRRATPEKAEQIESLNPEEQNLFQSIYNALKNKFPNLENIRLPALVEVLGLRAINAVTADLQKVQARRQPIAM